MDRLRKLALPAAFLLLLISPVRAGDAHVEEVIRRQDGLMDRNKWAEVVADAKAELERTKSAASHYLLGRAYGLGGEFEKAREQFDWSIEKDPAFAYPYYGLGVYFMMKNNMEEAERHFNQSLELDPDLGRAHAQLGKLFVSIQDLAGAEREFQLVLAKDPANQEVRTLLGHLYLRQKRFDRAIREFQAVLGRDPEDRAGLKGVAVALGFDRQMEEAIAAFERYLAVEAKDLEAYVFLASLYEEQGMVEPAVATLERLIKAAPEGIPLVAEAEQKIERLKAGGDTRKRVTIEELIELLDSDDLTERREAMRYLVDIQIHPPPRKMVEKVSTKYESDPLMRVMAVNNLGVVGGASAVSLLQVITLHEKDRDPDEMVRGAAVSALAAIRTHAAIPVLLDILDDPSLYVFRLAIDSLREYSGIFYVEDPSAVLEEEQREELTGKWRSWWQSSRAFALKLDTVADIERLKFKRFAQYLVPLLADEARMVAENARNAFFIVTAVQIGSPTDVDTPEGRTRLTREALKVLQDRKLR